MSRRRGERILASAAAAFALLLCLGAAPALATFHLIQIREVYPGSAEAEYVELQMWAGGQNHVAGHVLRSYDAGGAVTGISAFPRDVPSGLNQSTLLLATAQAEAQFGVVADAPLVPNSLSPAGGAVCWESIDCVAWGSFSGTLPSPAGSPAAPAGIPDGMALRRSISPGCATLLEPTDDNDESEADFQVVFPPPPRPNSVAPTERSCAAGESGPGIGSGGGSGSGPGAGPASGIETTLRGRPSRRTHDRTPTFRFTASDRGASFECKLDRRPYRRCRSPYTARPIGLGRHGFLVRARSGDEVDPTPSSWSFRVLSAR
ncbi:MAG: hypothetical protein ACJ76D_02070 [Solirubrobacterales bacterium]